MNIQISLNGHIKKAMLARNKDRLRALRGIKSALITEMKVSGLDSLSDEKSVKVLRMLAKQRADSESIYSKAGREDLSKIERAELEVINEFLPSLAEEDETRVWIQDAIDSGISNIGAVIGAVMRSHKSEADGKLVRKLAQEML